MVQKYTFTYSRVCGIDIELDIYLPDPQSVSTVGITAISSVVFFHGGDLTWGSREILPEQLKGMMILGLSFHLSFFLADCTISFLCRTYTRISCISLLLASIQLSFSRNAVTRPPPYPPKYKRQSPASRTGSERFGSHSCLLDFIHEC